MKKSLLAFMSVLLFTLALLAGCAAGGAPVTSPATSDALPSAPATSPATSDASPGVLRISPSGGGSYGASITPAPGWEASEDPGGVTYTYADQDKAPGAMIQLAADTLPASGASSLDGYVTAAQNKLAMYIESAQFDPATHVTVAGADAVKLTFLAMGSVPYQYEIIYILEGETVYSVTCLAPMADFDDLAGDFQSMIDSFTAVS